jgi:hypothetical protein
MNEIIKEEQEIKANFDKVELPPFETKMEQIRPRLTQSAPESVKTEPSFRPNRLAIVTSFALVVILLGVGLYLYFRKPTYADANIQTRTIEQSQLSLYTSAYIPDIDILENKLIQIGEHKKSHEIVYIKISGTHGTGRELTLLIVLVYKYQPPNHIDYISGEETIIGTQPVTPNQIIFGERHTFAIGFTKGDTRYFIDYTTDDQHDLIEFLHLFLT